MQHGPFLKWQPCHFPVMVICFVYVNLPTVLLTFFINVTESFLCNGIMWPLFSYVHHNSQSLLIIFLYWTQLLEYWTYVNFNNGGITSIFWATTPKMLNKVCCFKYSVVKMLTNQCFFGCLNLPIVENICPMKSKKNVVWWHFVSVSKKNMWPNKWLDYVTITFKTVVGLQTHSASWLCVPLNINLNIVSYRNDLG